MTNSSEARLDSETVCSRILNAKDMYALLSVGGANITRSSSQADVRKAYKDLVALVHPDKVSIPDARKAFQELTGAYKQILDPKALDDGWQEDKEYVAYTQYQGQWYQDEDGTWYTDHDYKDKEGKWHRRTSQEVAMLQKLQKLGVQQVLSSLQPHEFAIVESLKKQQESHQIATENTKKKLEQKKKDEELRKEQLRLEQLQLIEQQKAEQKRREQEEQQRLLQKQQQAPPPPQPQPKPQPQPQADMFRLPIPQSGAPPRPIPATYNPAAIAASITTSNPAPATATATASATTIRQSTPVASPILGPVTPTPIPVGPSILSSPAKSSCETQKPIPSASSIPTSVVPVPPSSAMRWSSQSQPLTPIHPSPSPASTTLHPSMSIPQLDYRSAPSTGTTTLVHPQPLPTQSTSIPTPPASASSTNTSTVSYAQYVSAQASALRPSGGSGSVPASKVSSSEKSTVLSAPASPVSSNAQANANFARDSAFSGTSLTPLTSATVPSPARRNSSGAQTNTAASSSVANHPRHPSATALSPNSLWAPDVDVRRGHIRAPPAAPASTATASSSSTSMSLPPRTNPEADFASGLKNSPLEVRQRTTTTTVERTPTHTILVTEVPLNQNPVERLFAPLDDSVQSSEDEGSAERREPMHRSSSKRTQEKRLSSSKIKEIPSVPLTTMALRNKKTSSSTNINTRSPRGVRNQSPAVALNRSADYFDVGCSAATMPSSMSAQRLSTVSPPATGAKREVGKRESGGGYSSRPKISPSSSIGRTTNLNNTISHIPTRESSASSSTTKLSPSSLKAATSLPLAAPMGQPQTPTPSSSIVMPSSASTTHVSSPPSSHSFTSLLSNNGTLPVPAPATANARATAGTPPIPPPAQAPAATATAPAATPLPASVSASILTTPASSSTAAASDSKQVSPTSVSSATASNSSASSVGPTLSVPPPAIAPAATVVPVPVTVTAAAPVPAPATVPSSTPSNLLTMTSALLRSGSIPVSGATANPGGPQPTMGVINSNSTPRRLSIHANAHQPQPAGTHHFIVHAAPSFATQLKPITLAAPSPMAMATTAMHPMAIPTAAAPTVVLGAPTVAPSNPATAFPAGTRVQRFSGPTTFNSAMARSSSTSLPPGYGEPTPAAASPFSTTLHMPPAALHSLHPAHHPHPPTPPAPPGGIYASSADVSPYDYHHHPPHGRAPYPPHRMSGYGNEWDSGADYASTPSPAAPVHSPYTEPPRMYMDPPPPPNIYGVYDRRPMGRY